MAQTLGFAHLPGARGGRGLILAYGTVADVVTGGSWSATLSGSLALQNIQAPLHSVMSSVYGTAVQAEVTGSTGGYMTATLWDLGTGVDAKAHAGTVVLSWLAIGGLGSI